jgi:hypothetical protein
MLYEIAARMFNYFNLKVWTMIVQQKTKFAELKEGKKGNGYLAFRS